MGKKTGLWIVIKNHRRKLWPFLRKKKKQCHARGQLFGMNKNSILKSSENGYLCMVSETEIISEKMNESQ